MKTPPYLGAPAAPFIGATGPVYALVGTILDRTNVPESHPVQVLVAPETVREYRAEFLAVFEFFQTPREEYQVREWLAWAGSGDDFLKTLLDTRSIVRVDARDPLAAAKSLRGLRIVPQCFPDTISPTEPGRFDVKKDEAAHTALSINVELGEALFGERAPADVPTVIKSLARKFKLPRDLAARKILSTVPLLLQHGYARLEWLNAPRV